MSPHVRHMLTLELACPRCKAAPGKRCTNGMFHGEPIEMMTPCEERIDAAKAASPPAVDVEQQVAQRIAAWMRAEARKRDGAPLRSEMMVLMDRARSIEDGSWKE